MKWFLGSIRFKLVLAIAGLVIPLLSLIGFSLSCVTQQVLRTQIEASHREIARGAAREIALFSTRVLNLLQQLGRAVSRADGDIWHIETHLIDLSLDFPSFEEIVLLDPSGRVLASSNPGLPSEIAPAEFLEQTLRGELYVSELEVKNDYMPHRTVAIPLLREGRLSGILAARVNVRGLWKMVDDIRIGKTGCALLLNESGLVLSHPDKRFVLENRNFFKDERLREGKIYSIAKVESVCRSIVVFQMDQSEAYELLRRNQLFIWAAILGGLLACIPLSAWLAKRLVRPVRELDAWSRKIGRGDYAFRVEPRTRDELGRLFIRFKRMTQRLEEARSNQHLAALGDAATSLSHKLKNAIVSLKTFAQLLPTRKQDPKFMERFEKEFTEGIEYLENAFQNLSQVSVARLNRDEAVNLREILESLADRYAEAVSKAGVRFHLRVQAGLPQVRANGSQLREVFLNLIHNALQAMPNGGDLTVKAYVLPSKERIQIVIQDTGEGIPEIDIQNIFKPFFSTKPGGMGLGLSISKKIIQSYDGLIWASSSHKGTSFTIQFPVHSKVSSASGTALVN